MFERDIPILSKGLRMKTSSDLGIIHQGINYTVPLYCTNLLSERTADDLQFTKDQ